MLIIGFLLSATLIMLIFFNSPCSKTKTEFEQITKNLIANTDHEEGVFEEGDIAGLPVPVQNYFRYCGYIGTPKMSYATVVYKDVDFSFGRNKPMTKIDYTQYNFVNKPNRIAYIDSSMYSIPFEGLDSYIDGAGSMKGLIAKLFTLFYETGEVMDKSSLVTFLSESLIIPNAALQDYIVWEAMDDLHARANITCYGISASGIFTFNKNGEMLSFTTDDREVVSTDGTSEKVRWSILCNEYKEMNGIKKPTVFQAIWNYNDGDLVYFNGKGTITAYQQYNQSVTPKTAITDKLAVTDEPDKFEVSESDKIPGWKRLQARVSLSELTEYGSNPINDNNKYSFSIHFPGSWTIGSSVLYDANNKKVAEIPPVILLNSGQESVFLDYKPAIDFGEELISKEESQINSYPVSKTITRMPTESYSWYPHIYRLIDGSFGFSIYFYSEEINEEDQSLFDQIVNTFNSEQ